MRRNKKWCWIGACFGVWMLVGCGPATLNVPREFNELYPVLHQMAVDKIVKTPKWGRPWDGYTYTVDVGHLMVYAAIQRDKPLYQALRTYALRALVLNQPKDEFTKGFVLWRHKDGEKPDATGTTEALRVAEGFWRGAAAFQSEEDKKTALLILEGYLRHEFVDQGIWLIRNYFNLGTRTFVTNSFLVDYDPDLLQEVGEATQNNMILEGARKSYALIRRAEAPSGLLYSVIQPEIGTLLPLDLSFFSPNDVIKLLNCSSVAERSVRRAAPLSRRVLNFVALRADNLNRYYYGRTGEIAKKQKVGATDYASLIRLAARLRDADAAAALLPAFLRRVREFVNAPYEPQLYVIGEVLLGFQVLAEEFGHELPQINGTP